MRRLLLVSSSTVHGTAYLEHCEPHIRQVFDGVGSVLFVPYALQDHDGYTGKARKRFERIGLGLESVHRAEDPVQAVEAAEGIFIGGGNTFRLLSRLHSEGLIEPIRRRVEQGMPYMGTSAGSNVACPTIKTSNDMPIVYPPTFDALNLISFQINPHYIDPDASSTHMGETRDQRLAEFLEENDATVIGLREGALLVVEGEAIRIEGETGGKLFRRGDQPRECLPGTRIALG